MDVLRSLQPPGCCHNKYIRLLICITCLLLSKKEKLTEHQQWRAHVFHYVYSDSQLNQSQNKKVTIRDILHPGVHFNFNETLYLMMFFSCFISMCGSSAHIQQWYLTVQMQCRFKKCEAEHGWKSSEESYRSRRLHSRSWHARGHHHPWHHRWHHAWHLIKETSWNIHLAFPYHPEQAEVLRHSVRQGVGVCVEGCLQLGREGDTETGSAVLI